jgi:carboxylesterase type B
MPGVPHGGELPFVFGTETPSFGAFTPADWEMSGRVMDYWYAFALTGTPEPVGAPTWLPTSAGNDQTMMFGEKIEMQPDFLRKQTDGLLVFLQSPISAWLLMYSCISQ